MMNGKYSSKIKIGTFPGKCCCLKTKKKKTNKALVKYCHRDKNIYLSVTRMASFLAGLIR